MAEHDNEIHRSDHDLLIRIETIVERMERDMAEHQRMSSDKQIAMDLRLRRLEDHDLSFNAEAFVVRFAQVEKWSIGFRERWRVYAGGVIFAGGILGASIAGMLQRLLR